jgi:ABC-type transporter Mla MlaB component
MTLAMTYAAGRFLVEGSATFETLGELSRELLAQAAKPGELVLDLAQLGDCDSVFVATLTACLQNKQKHRGSVVLENTPARLKSMLGVYGLADSGFIIS